MWRFSAGRAVVVCVSALLIGARASDARAPRVGELPADQSRLMAASTGGRWLQGKINALQQHQDDQSQGRLVRRAKHNAAMTAVASSFVEVASRMPLKELLAAGGDGNGEKAANPEEHSEDEPETVKNGGVDEGAEMDATPAPFLSPGLYKPGMMIVTGKIPWMNGKKCLSTDGTLLFMEDCYRGHRLLCPDKFKWRWTGRNLVSVLYGNCILQPWHDEKTHGSVELIMDNCTTMPNQRWYFDSFQRLKNEFEGQKCMDVQEGKDSIYMNFCDGRNSQWFSYY